MKNRNPHTEGTLQTIAVAYVDIVIAVAYLILATLLIVRLPPGSVLRALSSLPLLFVVPGYAVITALYPRQPVNDPSASGRRSDQGSHRSISGLQRGVLSVPISVGLLSVLGVAITFLGYDLSREMLLLGTLEGITVVGLLIGVVRRARETPSERFGLSLDTASRQFAEALASPSLFDRLLKMTLVALVLTSVGGLAFGVVSHSPAQEYTSMTLVTENESGEYVAGGYPTELSRGEEASLTVNIKNRERSEMQYTVVPVIQRVATDSDPEEDNGLLVIEQQQLEPIRTELADGESTYERHTFAPELTGTNLRLSYLLYVGDPPEQPTAETAYRQTHIWIDVSTGDS